MCHLSLRTICLTVAWVHIILSGFAIAFSFTYFHAYKMYGNLPEHAEDFQIGLPIILLYFVLNVTRLIIAVMLVKGILQERRQLMAPFVYGQCMITFCLGLITVDFWWRRTNNSDSFDYTFLDFLLDGVHGGLTLLLLCPIYMLYRKMGYCVARAVVRHDSIQASSVSANIANGVEGEAV